MIHIKINAILFLIIASIIGCKKFDKHPNSYLYISKNIENIDSLDVKIFLDDSLLVDHLIWKSNVTNDFEAFNFVIKKGKHSISAKSTSRNLIAKKDFYVQDQVFITIYYEGQKLPNHVLDELKKPFGDNDSVIKKIDLDFNTERLLIDIREEDWDELL